MPNCYIIMADVIGSSQYSGDGKSLMSRFRKTVNAVNQAQADALLSPLTITLGDEFQGIVENLSKAFQTIIQLEETRIHQDSDYRLRYVINYGPVDTELNRDRAHEMLGDGLTVARKTLESMKDDPAARCRVRLDDEALASACEDGCALYLAIIDDWRTSDYPLIAAFLEGLDDQAAADRLDRDRTSTLRKRRSVKMREYAAAKRLLSYLSGKNDE